MTATWPEAAWLENRFQVTCFQIGERWIQGGVVYGHAVPPGTIETRLKTDAVCSHVTEGLSLQSQGLRFVGGDFNQPDEHLKI